MITFVVGSLVSVLALLAIRKYPITRERIECLRARLGGAG